MNNQYVPDPQIGETVLLPDGNSAIIMNVIRPNSFEHWDVAVRKVDNTCTNVDIYYENMLWKAKEYAPTRFPDLDGVMKRM